MASKLSFNPTTFMASLLLCLFTKSLSLKDCNGTLSSSDDSDGNLTRHLSLCSIFFLLTLFLVFLIEGIVTFGGSMVDFLLIAHLFSLLAFFVLFLSRFCFTFTGAGASSLDDIVITTGGASIAKG